jgi:hypothetical protein
MIELLRSEVAEASDDNRPKDAKFAKKFLRDLEEVLRGVGAE